jgi:putative endonuclease
MARRSPGPWWVYVIRAANGALYTGITTDVLRRLREHRSGRRGARFFRFAAPNHILYTERLSDRSSAARREATIKGLSRAAKLALIRAARAG